MMLKKSRKVLVFVSLSQLTIILSVFNVWGETTPPDQLWAHAVRLASENQNLIPGSVYMHFEELNSKGKVTKTEDSWSKFFLSTDSRIQYELVKYLKNGKDITEVKKHKKSKNKEEYKAELSDFTLPFNPEIQDNILVNRTNRVEQMVNQTCVVYEYKIKTQKGDTIIGAAWLTEKGIPIAIKYSFGSLPKETPRFIKAAVHEVYYKYQEDGSWYPEKGIIELKGRLFFRKIIIRCQGLFGDYWKISKEVK